MHDMYRKLFSALALAFTLPVILMSCIMYHPQTADIPLIEKKGDLRVGGESVKFQLGLAYCMFSGSGFSDNATFQYDPLSVSLGLSYCF